MQPLRAVLLDAGGTLIHPDHAFLLDRLAEEGVDADLDDYHEARQEADAVVGDILRSDDPGNDQTRVRTWFSTLLLALGLPPSRLEAVAADIRERHARARLWVRPVPGTREMLEGLRRRGLRLAVISNADGRVEAYLGNAGLADLFEFILDSEIEGVEKPDPEIFHTALDRLGLDPEQTVYVGDTWPVDVVGARKVGIPAIYLSAPGGSGPDRGPGPGDADGVLRITSILELPEALDELAGARAEDTAGEGPDGNGG